MAFNFGIANKNITHNGVEYVMSEKQANAYNKYIAIVKRYQKKIDKIVNDIWPQATEKNVRNSPKPFASWNENVMMRW